MAHLTAQQALARLMDGGRRRVKGSAPTLVGELDGVYMFSNGIVSPADDQLNPILGYTDEEMSGSIPPSMAAWLAGYSLEVTALQGLTMEQEPMVAKAKAKAESRKSVPILVNAKWAQTAPFNQNLTIGGSKCMAGCVAIALAQILYCWGAQRGVVRGCMETPDYDTSEGWEVMSLPPITAFDYSHMTATKPTTKAAKAAVAQLVEYVGKALQSDYKPKSTGAVSTNVAPTLINYLRMGKGVTFVQSSKVGAIKFDQLLYNEVAAGRPVYMDGAIAANSTAGHAFVCDGYDADNDLYHFNWGWGGGYNGWFALSALTPYNRNYSFRKEAVVGINPASAIPGDVNGDGSVSVTDVMASVSLRNSGGYDAQADLNYDGKVDKDDITAITDKVLGK